MPHRFSRAELYRLVWASPVTTIAKQLGVSDTAVGKVCRAANVPLPPRGYWAKKAAGKGIEPTPLPAREIGQSDVVHFGDRNGYNAAPLPGSDPDKPSPPVPVFEEPIELAKARIQKTIGRVRLIRSLEQPHPRISSLLEDEDLRRQKAQKQAGLLPSEEPRLQTPGSQRKLRLLNSLFVTWSDAGWHPGGFDPDTGNLSLRVGDQVVPLRIQELPAHSKGPIRGRPTLPDLRLEIRAWRDGDSVLVWQDSKEGKIEDNLSEVATMVVLRGEELHRQDVLHRYNLAREQRARTTMQRQAVREKAEAEAREAARRLEQERVDRLLAAVDAIKRAATIRRLVAVLGERFAASGKSTSEANLWAAWASAYADRVDPLLMSADTAAQWLCAFRLSQQQDLRQPDAAPRS